MSDIQRTRAIYKRTVLENPFIPKLPETTDKNGKKKDGRPSSKQSRFLAYTGKEGMYGGAAGGGKTDALLMAALQFVEVPGYSALILRRTLRMLTQADGLIERSKEWFGNTGATYHQTDHRWTFPSGATLTFGYLDQDKHLDLYQGGAWQFIGFDEVTQFPESRFRYLFSRLRGPKIPNAQLSKVPLRLRCASNPGGIGHEWVKRRFIAGADPKFFVPSKVFDNPGLNVEDYVASLVNLDPIRRAQLMGGDWDAYEGGRFKEKWFRLFVVQRDISNVPRYHLSAGGIGTQQEYEYQDDGIRISDCYNVIIVDPAASEKDVDETGEPNPTAIGVFAITPAHQILVLQVVRKWLDIDDIPKEVAKLHDIYHPSWVGIEDNGFAVGITRACQKLGMAIKSLSHESKSKLVRATPAIIRCEAGQIHLPERGTQSWVVDVCQVCGNRQEHGVAGKDERVRCKVCMGPLDEAWCDQFVSELVQFTGMEKMDAYDDQVDCLSHLVLALQQMGMSGPLLIIPDADDMEAIEDRTAGGLLGWQR